MVLSQSQPNLKHLHQNCKRFEPLKSGGHWEKQVMSLAAPPKNGCTAQSEPQFVTYGFLILMSHFKCVFCPCVTLVFANHTLSMKHFLVIDSRGYI